jgi:hypothetical protein
VELNYSTADKELLAIVEVLKHWKQYLKGAKHKITIFLDHKNLQGFKTNKELN